MITLKPVTPDNFLACTRLSVREDQTEFVAPNVFSLAQAKVYPTCEPLAVYDGDTLVGFAMYGIDPDDSEMWISRLMIDQAFQGRGYGKAATRALIERIRGELPGRRILLSFEPENKAAEALYAGLGFAHTGQIIEGEVVMALEG